MHGPGTVLDRPLSTGRTVRRVPGVERPTSPPVVPAQLPARPVVDVDLFEAWRARFCPVCWQPRRSGCDRWCLVLWWDWIRPGGRLDRVILGRSDDPNRSADRAMISNGCSNLGRWIMSVKVFYGWQAVLAGAQFAVSGAMLTDLVGPHTAGAVGLVVGSLQVATATWASLTGARLVQGSAAIGNGQS